MAQDFFGRILSGNIEAGRKALEQFQQQAVDYDCTSLPFTPYPTRQRTISQQRTVTGPGTFLGKATRTLILQPSHEEGWSIDRIDLPDHLPTRVSVRNVWTTGGIVSNIVLRSGSPHNYIRMVEHIVAMKLGLGIDNLRLGIDSGDPPLFTRGSLDLLDALEQAGIVETDEPAQYWTVKEKVTCIAPHGGFVTLAPLEQASSPRLEIDCAVDFPNVIGGQRIRFPLSIDLFRRGAQARTNTTSTAKLYCQTIGRLFADVRNLGYNRENVLIAGKKSYINEPRLIENGKSLEAVWHRAALDLLAALALIEEGRFVGRVTSYRAGHSLDVHLITLLYIHNLLTPFPATS